jgi:hypothetical protein
LNFKFVIACIFIQTGENSPKYLGYKVRYDRNLKTTVIAIPMISVGRSDLLTYNKLLRLVKKDDETTNDRFSHVIANHEVLDEVKPLYFKG